MIVNQLRQYRELNSFTQEELARCVNVSRQTIISIEKGSYNPSLELAFKLSRILQVTLDDLFQWEDGNETTKT